MFRIAAVLIATALLSASAYALDDRFGHPVHDRFGNPMQHRFGARAQATPAQPTAPLTDTLPNGAQ